jgi:FKBP-type peptidyl-prolyl cis-trans isomerase FkpA
MKHLVSICLTIILFSSCLYSDIEELEVIDYNALNEIEIQEYIAANDLSPEKSNSGLYYIINKEGDGAQANENSTVTTYYKLYDTDKNVIEESDLEGVEFELINLIPGFREGITYLKEGGEATFIIPSKLAYASNPFSPLQNEVLIFDVMLISVK